MTFLLTEKERDILYLLNIIPYSTWIDILKENILKEIHFVEQDNPIEKYFYLYYYNPKKKTLELFIKSSIIHLLNER